MSIDLEKLEEIKDFINNDHLATDIKLSIFTSAASCFKQDSLLSPFPKKYLDGNGIKEFERLVTDVDKIPSLEEIMVLFMAGNTSVLSNRAVTLLHWVLTSPKYNIESVPRFKFEDILTLPKATGKITKPTHIFKINYVADSGAEAKFQQLKATLGYETKYAYHGTRFYNMYSILNYGLQQHLNKTGLFGEGLYFAQELDVSLLFSPSVMAWNKSKCGNNVSCVAICEYINDPSCVKVRKENAKNSDIPQSYLLITNNEVVRVRYILVYGSKKVTSPLPTSAPSATNEEVKSEYRTGFFWWCRRNPLIVSVFLYLFLLFLVGASNHRIVEYYKNLLIEFMRNRFKFL